MAKKADLQNISNIATSASAINSNFERLNEKLTNTVSRDGSTPNTMEADLDLNENDILNVKSIDASEYKLNGVEVFEGISDIVDDLKELSDSFATAAQGDLADSAVQPEDLATVATSGSFTDLEGRPVDVNYLTRTALVNAVDEGFDPAEDTVVFADGIGYRRKDGYSLPGLTGWRPLDNVLDIRHMGTDAELDVDFQNIWDEACTQAESFGWVFQVSPKRDGTPFEYKFLDHTLTGDLHVRFMGSAVFYPERNYQHFLTNGSTGPFTITEFDYDTDTQQDLSGMLVESDNSETKFVQGTDFTYADGQVTLTSTPPAGSTFVVCAREDAIKFRSTLGSGRKLFLEGHANINIGRFGYAISSASGTGLSLVGLEDVSHTGVIDVYSSTDGSTGWNADPLDKRGDSGVVLRTCRRVNIDRIRAFCCNDLALYITGGASSGNSDNTRGIFINSIHARLCGGISKAVRQSESVTYNVLHGEELRDGFILGDTQGLPNEGGIQINALNLVKVGRRAISISDVVGLPCTVNSIDVLDIGYKPDGVTAVNGANGIFMTECSGLSVNSINIRTRDWTPPAGTAVVQFAGDNNYGNAINGGYVEGLDTGVKETGSGTNTTGNYVKLVVKDCATPLSLYSDSRLQRDITVITESGGTVTSSKQVRKVFPTSFTPAMYFAGNATPTPVRADGTYTMDDAGRVTMSFDLQAQPTHAGASEQLRFDLPPGILGGTISGDDAELSIMIVNGINPPTDGAHYTFEIADNPSYGRIRYFGDDGTSSGSAGFITADHCVSGNTIRVKVTGTFFAL